MHPKVGTANNDFDEYALTSIEVHSPSEHTFRHASWPVELQLWHTPRSLVRISQLGEDAKALANRSARAEALHWADLARARETARRAESGALLCKVGWSTTAPERDPL